MADIQLTFEVTNQLIHRTDKFKPVADSKNYLYAHFDFLTEEWENKIVTAIFTKNEESYIMLLDSNYTCLVPWEVIQDGGDVYVSVFSGELITTNSSRVTIIKSGYVEDAENSEEPTPNIYEQIIASFENLSDDVSELETDISNLRQDLLVIDGGTIEDWTKGE